MKHLSSSGARAFLASNNNFIIFTNIFRARVSTKWRRTFAGMIDRGNISPATCWIARRPDEIPESSFHANKISPVAPNGYAPKREEKGRRRRRRRRRRRVRMRLREKEKRTKRNTSPNTESFCRRFNSIFRARYHAWEKHEFRRLQDDRTKFVSK